MSDASGKSESKRESLPELAHKVAAVLDAWNEPGGVLYADGDRSTAKLYFRNHARDRWLREVREEYLALQPDVSTGGRTLLVTAGAPGAGKSRAMRKAGLDRPNWRVIDADVVKEQLIRRALHDGIYSDLLATRLPDGQTLQPLELGSLVHRESLQVARSIRTYCMRNGEDLVVEGTLSSESAVDSILTDVNAYGYGHVEVLTVHTPVEVAIERALKRWWSRRIDPANDMGGRFMPTRKVRANYTADGQVKGYVNAQALEARAKHLGGLDVELTAAPPEFDADLSPDVVEGSDPLELVWDADASGTLPE